MGWIVQTTQNSELFLNTLALSYIMDIDELVFQTVVPIEVSYIISNMDGLPLQSRGQRWIGQFPLRSVFTITAVTCTFLVIHVSQLQPVVSRIQELKNIMCP